MVEASEEKPAPRRGEVLARRWGEHLWRIIVTTVGSCLRHRVTGLAAEAAFFAVLSVPPLIFALAGSIGFVSERFTATQLDDIRNAVLEVSRQALTERAVDTIIAPTIDSVLDGGRYDVISIGFILALWSGSRALNVFVDTITIMHGLGGQRGIVATRALSFVLYALAMVTGAVSIPLVVAGPRWSTGCSRSASTSSTASTGRSCWRCASASWPRCYHVSVPVRTKWRFNLPGATFSLFCWVAGSYVLRWVLTVTAAESRSIYGPLAAPIAVLLWLYLLALAVLIGAAVNAACDTVFPQKSTTRARLELMQRLRERIERARLLTVSTSSHQPSVGRVSLPERNRSPWWELGRRLLMAVGILVGTVLLVYFDREGYRDGNDPTNTSPCSTRSTTRPSRSARPATATSRRSRTQARLVNAIVITPARIAFLVLLIGTTLEVLASQGREMIRVVPVEEEDGSARRRRRLRHQGPQRDRDPRQQRLPSARPSWSSTRARWRSPTATATSSW